MPSRWQPLPRIAFAVATFPFAAQDAADLPLELGDELYIIEQGGHNGEWFRGYLVAPPSLLAGLTSVKGQTLEARVFSGIFPRSCVEVREVLGDEDDEDDEGAEVNGTDLNLNGHSRQTSVDSVGAPLSSPAVTLKGLQVKKRQSGRNSKPSQTSKGKKKRITNGGSNNLSVVVQRDPNAPKPPAPVPMLKIGDENPTSNEPLVDEIASCLREWHSTNLHELVLSRKYPTLENLNTLVATLDLARRQFLHNVLTTHELGRLREKTVWDLVKGNKLVNGEIIVRDPVLGGRILTGEDSAVEITTLQSIMSLLDERPLPPANESLTLHHLLIDVKAFVGASTESTTLVFFLASKTPGQAAVVLSENYIVEVPASGGLSTIGKPTTIRTLFTDLASSDIGDLPSADSELYLVVKVRTTQQVQAGKPGSRNGIGSRDGGAPVTRGAERTQSMSAGKSGRRSLMWGQKAQRNTYAKNSPISSKLNSLSEQGESIQGGDDEGPPSTADSRGPGIERRSTSVSRIVTRTVGIGAIKVNAIMKQDEEVEQVMAIWSPASGFGNDRQDQDDWEEVIKDLLPSRSEYYTKSKRAERLQVHLRSFDSPDADVLIKSTPTLLSNVNKTCKVGFSGAPTKPRSDIYVTLDEAFLPRHALLSRSAGSATPLSNNVVGSNLQVTLEVRKASGERVENCILSSSNSEPSSSWESTTAERGEAWDQQLKLCIPPNDVGTSHLCLTLSDVPNQPFAICHLPLWDQQAFIRDGHHSLLLYRYDDSTSTTRSRGEGRTGYLSLPWNARGKDDVSKDEAVTGPIATLRLQTYLCSTRFSQDKVLLGLLNWKQQPPGDVQELLKRLVFVPEIEIVKLLSDVFDAIFSILVEQSGNDEYEDLCFSALVTVLGIVHDRRFNLGPLVDQYAENKFNSPFATPCLVRSFTRLLSNPSDPETSRKLRATFKVVKHILKFITHARGQQKAKEAGIGITSTSPGFTRHLRSIFKALDALMRNTAPILVGSQTLAVQHFHTWLPELTGLLSTEEILHIAIDFMDSCSIVKGKLVLYKLVLIINYSRLELFSQTEQRAALSANTVRWIAPHWGKTDDVTEQYREQVRLCCSILSTQVETLGPEIPDYIPKIIDSYLALQPSAKTEKKRLSLLFPTTYPFPSKPISGKERFDEVLIELSAILSAISTLPAGMQLELAEEEMALLLEDTLKVHLSILHCEAFPPNWLSVHIYHHKSTMKTLEYLAGILLESFLPDPDEAEGFNTELWKGFFAVLLKLVGSDALALETFPEQKRRAVWKIAGDVRDHGSELLRRTWEAIGWETSADERQQYGLVKMGGYQVQYVPGLVGPIIELCLSVHEGLRRVAVEVLQSMIVSEWTLSEDLSVIQTEMIDCLDRLFKSKPLTESILQKLFINELLGLFDFLAQVPEDPLYAAIKELIATIDEFLDLLVAVHSTDVTGEASHMIHRLRLMEFLRDMQKEEIFIRYVHQLAQLQSDARNPTEAGLALRLHADLYEWDPTKIVPPLRDPEFPAQSQFDRKERIYFDIIKNFEEGEAWSSALAAYQELQAQYQENVYDFNKLARTQRAIATIYETIAKSDKLVPKYFRVTYRGMGFPPSLRDKEFIFEGSPTERTNAFTDRMQEQHPSAQIVSSGDVDDVEGQFLQISILTPYRDVDHHVFQRARVPNVIRDYLLTAHPQFFSTTIKRTTSGPVEDHFSEKIIYKTAESFPTILRRSEIVSVDRLKLGAVQTGLERIIRKTAEMAVVEKRLVDGEDEIASLLIDALQLQVNPNSDSTVVRYRALLPTMPEGEEEVEMELTPLETALKIALIDHTVLIKRCIGILAKSPKGYLGTAEKEALTQNFESTFAPELASFAFPQQLRDPTPTPSWALASPVQSDGSRRDSQMMGRGIINSHTNGTLYTQGSGTDVLDTPGARAGRNRMSFLKRLGNQNPPPPMKEQEAVLAPVVNGNGQVRSVSGSVKIKGSVTEGRKRGKSGASDSESIAKENANANRMSFFSGGNLTTLGSIGRGRGRDNVNYFSDKNDDSEWITQSDLASQAGGARNGGLDVSYAGRRSSSSARPKTSGSRTGSIGRDGSVGKESAAAGAAGVGTMGSVRKRFSMLKLGKKTSKASVLVDSVAEED